MSTRTLTTENFEREVLEAPGSALVDVWAPWCGPCNAVAPVIEELADEYDGKAIVGKLNVDDNPDLTQRYNISSIPTVLVFHGGEVVDRLVGVQPKSAYSQALDAVAV